MAVAKSPALEKLPVAVELAPKALAEKPVAVELLPLATEFAPSAVEPVAADALAL